MSDAVTISMPAADVARVQAQMRRLETEVGKSASDALRFAAWAMARSLAGSTKIAPKMRRVVKNPDGRAGKDGRVAKVGMMVYRGDRQVFQPLRDASDPRRNIRRRGLAKAAWMWGIKALGKGGGAMASGVADIAKRNMAVTKRMTGADMFVKFEDRLPYASRAFKAGEKPTATAAARAADNMKRMINIKLYGKKYAS